MSEDIVNNPRHYSKWLVQPITFIMRNDMPFWMGNIVKYASRSGLKMYPGMGRVESEIVDLEKVKRYADYRIMVLRGETLPGELIEFLNKEHQEQ